MNLNRNVVTPLAAGAFLLSALTGVLIFFHLDSGLNKAAHEWLSWALLVAVGLHLSSNFSSLKRYFKARLGRSLMGGFALLFALSFIPVGSADEPPFLSPVRALAQAPLATVAQVARISPDELRQRLAKAGVQTNSDQQSLNDLLGNNTRRQMQILGQVMKPLS